MGGKICIDPSFMDLGNRLLGKGGQLYTTVALSPMEGPWCPLHRRLFRSKANQDAVEKETFSALLVSISDPSVFRVSLRRIFSSAVQNRAELN
jgi:hypothetical protein